MKNRVSSICTVSAGVIWIAGGILSFGIAYQNSSTAPGPNIAAFLCAAFIAFIVGLIIYVLGVLIGLLQKILREMRLLAPVGTATNCEGCNEWYSSRSEYCPYCGRAQDIEE